LNREPPALPDFGTNAKTSQTELNPEVRCPAEVWGEAEGIIAMRGMPLLL